MKSYKLKNGDAVWKISKPTYSQIIHFISINGTGMVMVIDSYIPDILISDPTLFKVKTIKSDLVRVMYIK